MKKISLLVIAVIFSMTSCKNTTKTTENETATSEAKIAEPKTITVSLEPKSDTNVSGEVMFTEENGIVTMKATLSGLADDGFEPNDMFDTGIQQTNHMGNGVQNQDFIRVI